MSIANMVMRDPGRFSVQQLQQAMERGVLPAYIAIPIIQEKVQQQKQAQQQTAMQQEPQPPIAQQIMQEAQGVAALPTNLPKSPEEYAAGGIVAFAGGGDVERFQAGGRSAYEEYARRRARELGIDPDLAVRLFNTESAFNPTAVSPKGAVGIGQLMPGTAGDLGLKPEERTDPFKNIDASLRYFKQQQDRFGDPRLAAAAYNAGPGALMRNLQQNQGQLNVAQLPRETQNYLPKVVPTQPPQNYLPQMGAALLAQSDNTLSPEFGGGEPSYEAPRGLPNPEAVARYLEERRSKGKPVGRLELADIESGRTAIPSPEPSQPTAATAKTASIGPAAASVAPSNAASAGILSSFLAKERPSASFTDLAKEIEAFQQERLGQQPSNVASFQAAVEPFLAQQRAAEEAKKVETANLRAQLSGKAYEGLEADLRKEAEQMGADKEQAKYMAMFKAGLAMMSGTSPRALENIGRGTLVGVEDYKAAVKDIRQAQKENQRMMVHIENARRAEQRGDIEKQIEELDRASIREQNRNQLVFSGQLNAGVSDRNEARQTVQNLTTVAGHMRGQELAASSREDIAMLRAMLADKGGAITPQLRMQALKMVDENKLQIDALKALDLKKTPTDQKGIALLQNKINELREQEVRRIIGTAAGNFGAAPQQDQYAGFKLRSVSTP